jgi:phosphoribosylformylglycinamidine cyclo-ligase
MPGIYRGDDFDLAGCIVGVVEKDKIIDGSAIKPGDVVFGLPSNGLHTNGYSLVRGIIFEQMRLAVDDVVDELGCTVGDELLRVHRSYLDPVTTLLNQTDIKGLAHVTGGGIVENLPRVLPQGCGAKIRRGSWTIPPIFDFLRTHGEVEDDEMYRVFNMGLGMLIVVGAEEADKINAADVGAFRVGEIENGDRTVLIS